MKAEIIDEGGLWIIVHRENNEGVMYAVQADEIEAIKQACEEWIANYEKKLKEFDK
jgi:hypothetical protein